MPCLSGSGFVHAHESFPIPGGQSALSVIMIGLYLNNANDAPYLTKAKDFNRVVFHGRSVHIFKLMAVDSRIQYSVVKISDEAFDVIDVKPHFRHHRHHANCVFPAYATEVSDVSENVPEAVVISVAPPRPPPPPPPRPLAEWAWALHVQREQSERTGRK